MFPQKPLVLVADQLDLGVVVVALDTLEVVDVGDVEGDDPARDENPGALLHDRLDVLPVLGVGHALLIFHPNEVWRARDHQVHRFARAARSYPGHP